jgi:cysteine desulfurase
VRAWQEVHPGRTAHTIVSAIEHDAVLVTAQALREMGVEVSIVPVNKEGVIDLELLASLIKKETVLISIMYANNEIGTIQPIKEIAKIIRRWKKEARGTVRSEKIDDESRYPLFHTDATQAVNYCDMHIPALGVDLLTMNGAKVYGPKGVGLLYVARHIKISAVSFGGGQEKGLRPGTENTAAIVGFAHALTLTRTLVSAESERLLRLRDELIALLTQQFDDIIINGSCLERLPNNVHFSFPDVDHEFLAIVLDREGFAVATKSACNELDAEISHVLLALREAAESTLPTSGIRLSFGRGTTLAEIERFVVTLKKIKETILIPV